MQPGLKIHFCERIYRKKSAEDKPAGKRPFEAEPSCYSFIYYILKTILVESSIFINYTAPQVYTIFLQKLGSTTYKESRKRFTI